MTCKRHSLLQAPDGYPTRFANHMTKCLSLRMNVLIDATDLGVPVSYSLAYLLDLIDRDLGIMVF